MAITFVVDHQRRRVSTRAEGALTFADIAAHADAQLQARPPSYAELFDATGATLAITVAGVRSLVLRAGRVRPGGPLGPTAIVATVPVVFGLARMYSLLCDGVGVRVGVFHSVAEAEAWLDAPTI